MPDEFIGKKCLIMAHRGANTYAPQNTLPAFQKAFDLGFSSFETDIHCTKDNVIVVCHDYKINNVSDGIGKIADYSLDLLRSFDFGSYFSESFKNLRISTLDDLLELVKNETSAGIMNIEIKSPKNGESRIVEQLIDSVKNHGLFDRLLISSFDEKLLLHAKKIASDCRTGLLYPGPKSAFNTVIYPPFKIAKEIGAYSLHPFHRTLNKEIVNLAHSFGFKICAWTVNKKTDMEKCLNLGVDALITDQPELARDTINHFELKKYI